MSSQVRSLNPFALLGDDGDESPAPVAKAPAAAAPKAAAAPAPKAAGARAPRAPRANQAGEAPVEGEAPKFGRDRPSGRGGAGARGGRGGRGGANAARSNGGSYLGGDKPRRENGGGRNFDRHSQTAHKDSDKATAAGWGADEGKTELKAEVEGEADAKADEAAAATEAAAPVEEEDNSQTYEEFLAAKAAANLKIGGDLPEARKANEGVDESQWANQTLRTKKADEEEESLFAIKTKAAKAKKERAAKQTIEANFSFAAPSRPERDGERPARGRGGARGGGRGRGARGGPRGGAAGAPRGASRAQVQAPALEDAAAFPSLA